MWENSGSILDLIGLSLWIYDSQMLAMSLTSASPPCRREQFGLFGQCWMPLTKCGCQLWGLGVSMSGTMGVWLASTKQKLPPSMARPRWRSGGAPMMFRHLRWSPIIPSTATLVRYGQTGVWLTLPRTGVLEPGPYSFLAFFISVCLVPLISFIYNLCWLIVILLLQGMTFTC